MEEDEKKVAEGYRVQKNLNLQDETTAEPSVSTTRSRVSLVAESEPTWSKDIIDHDYARADGGEKALESSKRTGRR